MTRLVVDASVAAKWFLAEDHADAAARLRSVEHELLAPDLLVVEVASVMLKRVRAGQLGEDDAWSAVTVLPAMTRLTPSIALASDALRIALEHDRSAYDAVYVALALREGCRVVTADRRLYNGLHHNLPDAILWIEDVA